jgi:cytochrome c oxidase subunit 2
MINTWLGQPPNAAFHGTQIDDMIEFCHWFMLILFVGWTCFFLYCLYRFHHSRHPRADHDGLKGNTTTHIEFAVVLIDAMLLLAFAVPLWTAQVYDFPSRKGTLQIHAIAQQYLWNFHYPGADGKLGKRSAQLVTATNPVGLNHNDPAAADDIVATGEMHVPVNEPVIIDVTSKDVIHNYSSPAMRISQDAIPGTLVPLWFKPIKTGQYEIVCGQLCGAGHGLMKAILSVDSAEDYKAWLKEAESLKAKPTASAAANQSAVASRN